MISHTFVAFLALVVIIPAAFIVARRRPAYQAVPLVLIVVALFGPQRANIDLPLLPALDKARMPCLAMLLVALVKWRHLIRRAGWVTPWELLIVLGFVGHVVTSLNNGDAYTAGPPWGRVYKPGLLLRDGLNVSLATFLSSSTPFMLGRWFIRTPRHLDYALRVVVLNALVQAVLALIETRMSPVIHLWVYGYNNTGFRQGIRWGGYRPSVFTYHGLTFAMFMFWSSSFAQILARARPQLRLSRFRFRIKRVAWALGGMLIVCKTVGALVLGVIAAFLLRLARPRGMMILAAVLGIITLSYPLLRSRDVIPVDDVVAFVDKHIGEERAQSLEFRFVNEAGLMRRAQKRYWFGWGSYGRMFDYGSKDEPAYLTVDGEWVVVLGSGGLVAFVYHFGLLVFPILVMLFRYRKVLDPVLQAQLTGFTLVLGIQCIDLLPNSSQNVIPQLFAGALAGMASEIGRPGSEWRLPRTG